MQYVVYVYPAQPARDVFQESLKLFINVAKPKNRLGKLYTKAKEKRL